MKRHPTPLWPGWNLSYHYQQAACSKQHGGSTVTVVVAAPTSWTPPPKHTHTPQLNKVLITPHSFLSKCLPNHKRVTGLRAWPASTTAGAWCTGKHGGPEALIKMAMTPLRRAHIHAVSYTPGLAWVYQPWGLEYISRPRCWPYWRCLLGAHCLSMGTDVGGVGLGIIERNSWWKSMTKTDAVDELEHKQLPPTVFSRYWRHHHHHLPSLVQVNQQTVCWRDDLNIYLQHFWIQNEKEKLYSKCAAPFWTRCLNPTEQSLSTATKSESGTWCTQDKLETWHSKR